MTKTTAIATKDNTIVIGSLTETYGNTEPVATITSGTFSKDNLTAIAGAISDAVSELGTNDQLTVIVPQSAYVSLSRIFFAVNGQKAQTAEQALTNLTPAQRKAFTQDYVNALGTLATTLITIKATVRLMSSQEFYRLRLVSGPDSKEPVTGQKIRFTNETEVTVNGNVRKVALAADINMYVAGRSIMPNCEHTVEVRKNSKGNQEFFVTRMLQVEPGTYATTLDALKAFRDGTYTPVQDNDIRLMNRMILNAVVTARLPKVAAFTGKVAAAAE